MLETPSYSESVFINCPFDAVIFAIHDCGFVARCALEVNDSAQVRIDTIFEVISALHGSVKTWLVKAKLLPCVLHDTFCLLPSMVRIAHLSDFHLSGNRLFNAEHHIVRPLIEDLKGFHEEKSIDLVVCSGDFIDAGAQSFDNPKDGFDTFVDVVAAPILKSLSLGRDRFIITPGNHDVVRSADSSIVESGMAQELVSQEKVTAYIEGEDIQGSERMEAFDAFEKRFYKGTETSLRRSRYESVHRFDLNNLKVGVASLNSAWRCYDSQKDAGKIVIGRQQITRALEVLQECELRIAVVHHPLSDLADFDHEAIRSTVLREFDFLLRGHDHEGGSRTTQVVENAIFTSAAPGVLHQNIDSDSRTYANGYQIVDFVPENQEITTHARRFVSSSNAFKPNPDNGDDEGKASYCLPSKAEWQQFEEQRGIAAQIQRQYAPGLNQHLLTYGTDTVAPKQTADIFVMPEVVHRRRGEEGEAKEKALSLEALAQNSSNLMILGKREAGKTVLLNRLLTELSENVDKYCQIPVRIDFPEMGRRRVETMVNEFLGVGSAETKRIAKQHSLTLLIDDIAFREADKHRMGRLERFLEEYPNTRIVATHLQQHGGDLPRGRHEKLQLKPAEIKSFRVKQIRALVSKWFVESDAVDTPDQLENIVSLFKVLDIPRTPLSVSILLWIIEKQEGYRPKNKATMVQKFVERLLRKYGKEEVYSGRFDFKNKQRLLAELAHHMYRQGKVDYRVRYSQALRFSEEHMEGREFDFEAQPILDTFIEVGLLAKSDQQVQFRFECFFEYFLAKKMGFDDSFKEAVLGEGEYLKFMSEIEYFSGIERDQSRILKMLTTRLTEAYEGTSRDLKEEHDSYDDYLENNFSLVEALDESTALKNVEENRPSGEDIEAMQDQQLAVTGPSSGIRKKEPPATPFERLTRLLFLTAQVLRHTEETDEANLKTESYQAVVQAALTFTVLYKYSLERYLEENKNTLPEAFEDMATLMSDYAPVIVQLVLHAEVGTKKLSKVFREEIERVIEQKEISDLEKFFSVFLYADNGGEDYIKQIYRLIRELRCRYAEDSVFLKLIIYFYVRSRSKDMDNDLLNLMADVMVKVKGLDPSEKGRIIAHHRERKQKRRKKADAAQTALEF